MNKLTLTFNRERETKGTWRYAEDAPDDQAAVGSLYVKKTTLGENPPARLRVTIEEDG